MPSRVIVARELAGLLKAIAHADRIRMIEELRAGELDVNTLSERLGLAGARVSQHLGLLRLHRVVEDRRDGRRVLYRLAQPDFARWIVDGLDFIEGHGRPAGAEIEQARTLWAREDTTESEEPSLRAAGGASGS